MVPAREPEKVKRGPLGLTYAEKRELLTVKPWNRGKVRVAARSSDLCQHKALAPGVATVVNSDDFEMHGDRAAFVARAQPTTTRAGWPRLGLYGHSTGRSMPALSIGTRRTSPH